MSDRLVRLVLAVTVAVVGIRLLLLVEKILAKHSDVIAELARTFVPEPVEPPSVVRVDADGTPIPGWMEWPERSIVDPTDAGLPDLLTERGPEPPWQNWSEPLVEEPEAL